MIFQPFPCPPFATNTYVVACPSTKRAIVIDPAPGATPLVAKYIKDNNFLLEKIVLTHSHWDHIADVAPLKKEFNVPVYVHPLDRQNLETPGSDRLSPMVPVEGVIGAQSLEESDLIHVGEVCFRILHTPGHSPGGICLYCEAEQILFSGDTLFKGTIGNLTLPTADAPSMWLSLKKLSALPAETKVYPGHGGSTTIGRETWLARAEDVFGNS